MSPVQSSGIDTSSEPIGSSSVGSACFMPSLYARDAASVLKKNQELKTEKANKKLHGWGLRSVTDLVSKRNGLIDFYEKEGMFYVDILLPIEENLHLGD